MFPLIAVVPPESTERSVVAEVAAPIVVAPTLERATAPVVPIAAPVVTVEQSISKLPPVLRVPAAVLAKVPVTQLKSMALEVVIAP
jgi:hypothetical protein